MPKMVKRLWLRSPTGEWVMTPYGAGMHPIIRSINVRDNEGRWLTPIPFNWQWDPFRDKYTDNPAIPFGRRDSLLARTPDTVWWDAKYNPNMMGWPYGLGIPRSPHPADWTRLFYVAARVDPTWRIHRLGAEYADLSEAVGDWPDYNENMRLKSGPNGGALWERTVDMLTDEFETFLDFDHYDYSGAVPIVWDDGAPLEGFGVQHGIAFAEKFRAMGQHERGTTDDRMSLMLDLLAVRQMLETEWAQSNMGVGQYQPLWDMQVKRVIIQGTVTFVVNHGAESDYIWETLPELPALFNGKRCMIHVGTAYPGLTVPEHPYTPRVPINANPFGAVIIDQQGLPGPSELGTVSLGPLTPWEFGHLGETGEGSSSPYRVQRGWTRTVQRNFTITMEDPGEVNVVFSVELGEPAPLNTHTATRLTLNESGFHIPIFDAEGEWTGEYETESGPYPTWFRMNGEVKLNTVDIHYATGDNDTPVEFRLEDEGLGLFVG